MSNLGYVPDVNFTVMIIPIQDFILWRKSREHKIMHTGKSHAPIDLHGQSMMQNFFQQQSMLALKHVHTS